MQHEDAPEFSVVIASFSGPLALRRGLHSLVPQCAGGEIVVAANIERTELARLQRAFPQVRFISSDESSSVFQLRSRGLSAARGRWIALTEDHCTPGPEWIASLRSALGGKAAVVAGPVLPGKATRWTDRGLVLCEYANLLPPLRGDQLGFVSGVNAAYSWAALEGCQPVWRDGFYENEVSDALRAAGHEFQVAPEAVVLSGISMPLGRALVHFFRGGRRFGRYQSARLPPAARGWRLAIAPLVPLVLLARIIRLALTRRPGQKLSLFASLPTMASLLLAWALGEFAGYWGRTAGSALGTAIATRPCRPHSLRLESRPILRTGRPCSSPARNHPVPIDTSRLQGCRHGARSCRTADCRRARRRR